MTNKTWIWESNGEQGDFCDLNSQHEYRSGNLTDVSQAEAEALEQGDKVEMLDAPIDQNCPYDVQPGQQFNIWQSSEDGQGVDYQQWRD